VVTQFPFRVLWQFTEQTNWEYPAQVLISVSKRNFSLATNRNKVKRLVRELYRLNKHQLYDVLHKNKKQLLLSIHYQGKDILAYHQLEKSFQKMLAKLITQINQHQPTKVE
jgi:ribonuclease P protein component